MLVKYHPPMLYYIAVIATTGTLIGGGVAWFVVRLALRRFQDTVLEMIGEAIRLQDDRIRKGRDRDGQRTPPGQARNENEAQQLAQIMAGQSVDDFPRRG